MKDGIGHLKTGTLPRWSQSQPPLLVAFFAIHLLLIFFQGFWSTINTYWDIHFDKVIYIPVLSLFEPNKYTEPYYILTGTDTGYGFYGVRTATEKYFQTLFMDSAKNVIDRDRYYGLTTTNGTSRLKTYASSLGNYIAKTEELVEDDSTGHLSDMIKFRKDYIKKSFKWMGKKRAQGIKNCKYYTVKLIMVVPKNIWKDSTDNQPYIHVIEEYTFPVR